MRLANQNTVPAYKRRSGASFEQVDLSTSALLHAYGDSYTNPGLHASPSSNSYLNKLNAVISKTLTNRGDSGTGIMTAMNRFSALEAAGSIPRNYITTCMVGLNDSNRYGTDSLFRTFWKEHYRAFVCANLIASGSAGSDITATGWINNDPGTGVARLFGVGKTPKLTQSLYPTSAALSYTFNKDHVVFGFQISNRDTAPAYTWCGVIEVRIDGVLVDTIDLNPFGLTSFPGWEAFPFFSRVKIYSGLSNSSHTITIRLVSNPSNGVYVDYFGHFGNDSSDTKPLMLGHIQHIPNYAQSAPYNNGSDAGADVLNGYIDDIVAEVKAVRPSLPIVVVRTNEDEPALVSGDFHADGLHWNNSGHDKGHTKFVNRISAY